MLGVRFFAHLRLEIELRSCLLRRVAAFYLELHMPRQRKVCIQMLFGYAFPAFDGT